MLRDAHFVINLGLAGAATGLELRKRIMEALADIAGTAFGTKLKDEVQGRSGPEAALGALIHAVPRTVPIALLVDEYDAAIITDVSNHHWDSAKAGVVALHSLLVGTKSSEFGSRIKRCIVTGVAKFAHTTLFSTANNFEDFTGHPLLSAAIGFTEQEIRAVFPTELQRLAASLGTGVDGAVKELERQYNGYCFDGRSTCFNPHAVLKALRHGRITELELQGASGTNWLGLTPAITLADLSVKLQDPVDASVLDSSDLDIADVEAQRVSVIPLLLQTGILTFKPMPAGTRTLSCAIPNEYARRSMQSMIEKALPGIKVSSFADALGRRDHVAFTREATALLEQVPNSVIKEGVTRESIFHTTLFGAIYAGLPFSEGMVAVEYPVQRGRMDILIMFKRPPEVAWIFEVGITATDAAKNAIGEGKSLAKSRKSTGSIKTDTKRALKLGKMLDSKLLQAQAYVSGFLQAPLFGCAVVVSEKAVAASVDTTTAIVNFKWSRRVERGEDFVWEPLGAAPRKLPPPDT